MDRRITALELEGAAARADLTAVAARVAAATNRAALITRAPDSAPPRRNVPITTAGEAPAPPAAAAAAANPGAPGPAARRMYWFGRHPRRLAWKNPLGRAATLTLF